MRSIKLLLLTFVLAWPAVADRSHAAQTNRQAPTRKLNVLFIVADDLRNSLGCYGDTSVVSPNIDRLAKRGVRFDQAYCQYPVCNPSRTSFLTGLRPDTTRVQNNNTFFRSNLPDVLTLPELFKKNGYYTASLGKIFHRGGTMEEVNESMADPQSWSHVRFFQGTVKGQQGEGRNLTGGELAWCRWLSAEGDDEDQPDGQIATEAVRLINEKRNEPFFLAIGFHKPHDPFIAPKKYFDLYPPNKIKLPQDPANRSPEVPFALPNAYPQFKNFTDKERTEFKRAYLAGLTFTDTQLGKVLTALEQNKLWENTLIVFLGDHGYHLGERGWWNKNTLFELSARAPLLFYAPQAKANGKSSRALVEFVDLYPTIAELCGLAAPANLEGLSFKPLLDNPAREWKRAAFTQVLRGRVQGRTVRTARWRYTEWEGSAGAELYDHQNDPGEYRNLANDPAFAKQVAEMQQTLKGGWRAALRH